jgi:hypothetical protein
MGKVIEAQQQTIEELRGELDELRDLNDITLRVAIAW